MHECQWKYNVENGDNMCQNVFCDRYDAINVNPMGYHQQIHCTMHTYDTRTLHMTRNTVLPILHDSKHRTYTTVM